TAAAGRLWSQWRRQVDRLPAIIGRTRYGRAARQRHPVAAGVQSAREQLPGILRDLAADGEEHLAIGAAGGLVWRRRGRAREPGSVHGAAVLFPGALPGVGVCGLEPDRAA